MKALITGGRDFDDAELLDKTLSPLGITMLAQGGAKGADDLARAWAVKNKIPYTTFHAEWDKHGKAAGPIRNREMYDSFLPDITVAFPGGRGTRNMITYALSKGGKVIEIKEQ